MKRLTIPDEKIDGGTRRAVIDTRKVKEYAMTIYWALKKYEDTGLTPEQIMELKERDVWIPVEERLPEKEYDTVLCVTDKNYYLVCVYNKEIGFRISDLGMEGEIVAWRPLPDLYPEQITKLQKGSRWISVKEKLPENNNDVFVKTLEGNTSIGWYNSSLEVWFVNDKQENIIAWREKHGLFN